MLITNLDQMIGKVLVGHDAEVLPDDMERLILKFSDEKDQPETNRIVVETTQIFDGSGGIDIKVIGS